MQQIVFGILCVVACATGISISGSIGLGKKYISAQGSISLRSPTTAAPTTSSVATNSSGRIQSDNDQSVSTASQNAPQDGRTRVSIWGGLDRGRPVFGSDFGDIFSLFDPDRRPKPRPRPRPRPKPALPTSAIVPTTEPNAQSTTSTSSRQSSASDHSSRATTLPSFATTTISTGTSSSAASSGSSTAVTQANILNSSTSTEANGSRSSSSTEANNSSFSTSSTASSTTSTASPNPINDLTDRALSRKSRQTEATGLPFQSNVDFFTSLIPNIESPENINIPNIETLPDVSTLPQIPGVRDAIKAARDFVLRTIGGGVNLSDGLHQAMERAYVSGDAPSAIGQLLHTILDAYILAATSCPLLVAGSFVLREGIRLALQVAEAARNATIEGSVTIAV